MWSSILQKDYKSVIKIIVMDVLNVDVSGFKFPFCKRSFVMLESNFKATAQLI